ncbi:MULTISPECIES: copper-binding protein [Sphingomonadales]|uniref:Copper-binding protein n=1 Tax=Tsuneonella suprasediminis TaxID=2306996 RepID=A0A419R495_9SPHN|nr:copper-binding protein [Novosphingobium naphthalenivorans]RJX69467.1 copper-binding protein [Tsuneonella suprasediminis]
MKPIMMILGPALLLSACGQKTAEAPDSTANSSQPAVQAMETMHDAVGGNGNAMPMNGANMAGMASGMGMITAVDPKGGTVTIKHGPIPTANWPAMTMMFNADPRMLEGMMPGDQVSFDLKLKDGGGEITAIRKQ